VRGWGYLDDAEFARRWVENRLQHRPRGERLIKQELRVKGVDAATIDDVIEESSIDEHAAAMAVAEKAARRLQGLEPEVARRRLIGQLARRGFPYAVISPVVKQVLGEGEEDEFSEDLP